jgi:3-hydroxyacyl-CoA dehydrogenase
MSDMAGVDISHLAQPGLRAAYGPRARRSPIVERLYALGRHGQKAGRGYYRYAPGAGGHAERSPDPEVDALLAELRAARGVTPRRIPPDEVVARVLYVTPTRARGASRRGSRARPATWTS